jgi:hypothetical protein
MEEKEFVALVDELEGYARQNPGAYKLCVTMLAALGYVFLIRSRRWSNIFRRSRLRVGSDY